MKAHQTVISDMGLYADHDRCCPIYPNEKAVLNMNNGTFKPSWVAQNDGWRTLRARTRLQKAALYVFWGLK